MHIDVALVVQQPFDFAGTVFVPVAAVLTSAAVAIFIATREGKSSEKARVRTQAAKLIQTLNAIGRASLSDDIEVTNQANERYEQELNSFATYLNRRDIVVAKFVCVVVNRQERYPEADAYRTMLWVATALELWARGVLRSKEFEDNMPPNTTSWVDSIDLGQWEAVLRGQPAEGIADQVWDAD